MVTVQYLAFSRLEKLMFEGHVRLRLKPNARAEDVRQGSALLRQSIDHRSAGRRERRLAGRQW